jgi:dolichyl-phosphate-mannose-protein mannosyltransferase
VHPPLARLLTAACARLAGIPAADLLAGKPEVALRIVPLLLGALLVPLGYVLLRGLGSSRRVAALGALFVLADNALLVESRLDLPEPFLLFFGLGALTAFVTSRLRVGLARLAWLGVSALLAGCAVSVKWTGASALGIILVTWVWDQRRRPRPTRRMTVEGAMLIMLPAAVYVGAFAVHFRLLTQSGGSPDRIMSPAFQATLVGNPRYDPAAHVAFTTKLVGIHCAMMRGNATLRGVEHAGASPWYTWPIMRHPIGYWSTNPLVRHEPIIILLGNPLVWWGSLAVVAAAIVKVIRRRRRLGDQTFAFCFLLGGYPLNFLPFAAITRVMFLYHYLFALVLLALTAAVALGAFAGWDSDDEHEFAFSTR